MKQALGLLMIVPVVVAIWWEPVSQTLEADDRPGAYTSKPAPGGAGILNLAGRTVTVSFDREAKGFADGKRVFRQQLQAISRLALEEKLPVKVPGNTYYNIYRSNETYRINGSASYLIQSSEDARRFTETMQENGFQTGEAEMCLH